MLVSYCMNALLLNSREHGNLEMLIKVAIWGLRRAIEGFSYVSLTISRVDIGVQKLLEIDNKMYIYGPNDEKSYKYAISCDLLRLTFGGNI